MPLAQSLENKRRRPKTAARRRAARALRPKRCQDDVVVNSAATHDAWNRNVCSQTGQASYSKSTLDRLGRPLHDLRISVMDRCNFRCPYCMPKEQFHEKYRFLRSHERLSFDEVVRLSKIFVGLGVRKLRLTGGEPLLRTGLPDLIGDLTCIEGLEDIALTTNGVLLSRSAVDLRANGLKRINVSLDTLDPAIYQRMSGGFGSVPEVLEGIQAAIAAGLSPIKVNAVVERGANDHTVLELVDHFRFSPVIVRFIEYMDVGNQNAWRPDRVVPSSELLQQVKMRWPIHPVGATHCGEVAARWQFDDGSGEIGFISSVSHPFCGSCSRARLSSEGKFFTCLFASNGLDLRAAMRAGASDQELIELIENRWLERNDRYSERRSALRSQPAQPKKIEMHYIGG